MFVLLLSLLAVIVDGRYECDQYIKIAVAVLSMTTIYFVDIVLFILLIYLGWRGSPLNEAKRMPHMSVLVHLWVVCAIIKAGFTGFGLFVLYSPRISNSCWSSNPCDFYGTRFLIEIAVGEWARRAVVFRRRSSVSLTYPHVLTRYPVPYRSIARSLDNRPDYTRTVMRAWGHWRGQADGTLSCGFQKL